MTRENVEDRNSRLTPAATKGRELRYIKVFLYKRGLGSKSSEIDKEMPLCVYTGAESF